MMTKEQQRIALAEWMGWELTDDKSTFKFRKNGRGGYDSPPNYPEDLNAIHGAEMKLSASERYVYSVNLHALIYPKDETDAGFFLVLCATASQRSEALCRTLFPERWEK